MSETNPFEGRWFVQNTLPYVIPFLNVKDLLNASKTSKLWRSIVCERYLSKTFVPVCLEHKEQLFEGYGSNICRLDLIEHLKFPFNQHWKPGHSTRELSRKNYDLFKKLTALTHFRYSNVKPKGIGDFYWSSLLTLEHLTYLDITSPIPANFGLHILRYLKNLEVLTLNMNGTVDEHLFEVIGGLRNIKKLAVMYAAANEDLVRFLPVIVSLESLTLMLRAPCDTNYCLLMKAVVKLDSTLRRFCWVLSQITLSNAFFGQNCQEFLNLQNFSSGDRNAIEARLAKRFSKTRITVQIFENLNFTGKRTCFECVAECQVFDMQCL